MPTVVDVDGRDVSGRVVLRLRSASFSYIRFESCVLMTVLTIEVLPLAG